LKDVNREEFTELLSVIYPSCKEITENSAEFLLKLGDRFQIVCAIDRAEKFLIESHEVSRMEKLRIADQYNLAGLQKHCFSYLKTTADFQKVMYSPMYRDLSNEMKANLFEKVIERENNK
ncbi:hypothetical protein PMAYCL1PPCAC_24803, partial [Pristionchus mayeri]